MEEHKIEEFEDIKNFMFAGNATFTIKSLKSNDHLTFKIRKPNEKTPYFVSVLTNSDNDSDYTYLGTIFKKSDGHVYVHGKKSKISANAKSNKVFSWTFNSVEKNNPKFLEQAEVYHQNKCGRCGRTLTVPESIKDGLGPQCKKMTEG